MVMIYPERTYITKEGKEHAGFYMHKYLKENLDRYLIRAVKQNWDGVILVTGIEGSAKTTLGSAIASYLDKKFTLDNVVFSQKQFFERVDNCIRPGTCIIWDEFVMGGLSTEALTKNQNDLIKKMTLIRKKRMYVILIIPSIFMLRLYFIMRTRALIHCYSPDGVKRGFFKFYSYNSKRMLYMKGRKFFNMSLVRSDFQGDFTDTFGWFYNEKDYDTKKDTAILAIETEGSKENVSDLRKRITTQRDYLMLVTFNDVVAQQAVKRPGTKYTRRMFLNYLKEKFMIEFNISALNKVLGNALENWKAEKVAD